MNINFLPGAYRQPIVRAYRYTLWLLALLFFYIVAVDLNLLWLFGTMPSLQDLENPKSEQSSIVYSEDGQEMGKYFIENRSPVEFQQISPHIVNALLATEDVRFTQHSGIDPTSIFRVILRFGQAGGGSTITQQLAKNLFSTRRAEDDTRDYRGWVAKIPLIGRFFGLVFAKTKEWILAVRLESRYTKQEIMKMYLNEVSYGNNAYGIRVACRTYFNKEPKDVTIHEAAMLVGMLQNPSLYDPRLRPDVTRRRRNVVISQMAKYDFLTRDESLFLQQKPLILNYKVENQNYGMAPYFREVLRPQLRAIIKELNASRPDDDQLSLYTSGLRIFTTLDSRMQQYAEQSIDAHMADQQKKFYQHWGRRNPWVDENGREIKNFIEGEARKSARYKQILNSFEGDEDAAWAMMKKPLRMKVFSWSGERDTTLSPLDSIRYYKRILNVGFMSMNPENGHIKAWVGGINYKYFKYDHVRQSRRQPGSTFKPYVYAAAIEQGAFTPCDQVVDEPVTFNQDDGIMSSWTPQNAEGRYSYSAMTLRRGMGRSINTIAARLTKQLGVRTIAQMAYDCGIKSKLDETPALCLGASDVSVYEQVAGYSTFVNGGYYVEPMMILRIEDKKGNVLKEFFPISKQTITENTAFAMTYMLQGAVQEPGGTAQGLARYVCGQNNPGIGAKTGTTSNYSDGWFMGATPQLVTGVWVGGDNRSIHFRSLALGQGAKMAMPAFGMFMDKCYQDESLFMKKEAFKKPRGVTFEPGNCGGVVDSTSLNKPTLQKTDKPQDDDALVN
jgi:penicillin-binding protein 1A